MPRLRVIEPLRAALLLLAGAVATGVAASRPALAETLAASASGLPVVPVGMSGLSHPFLVATGRSTSAVLPDLAAEMRMRPAGTEAAAYMLEGLALDGQKIEAVRAAALPEPIRHEPSAKGILGADVLSRYTVEVDLAGGRLVLHAPGRPPAPNGAAWAEAALTLVPSRVPVVQPRIGAIPVTAIIDTGARRTTINWTAAMALGLAPTVRNAPPAPGGQADPLAPSLPKRQENRASAVAYSFLTLTLGTAQWKNVTLTIADLPIFKELGLEEQPAAVIGMDLLGARRFVIDFAGKRILLES
ncbi:MAG TPA: retropepsin-like aspartic protease [Azospirillaceae bacterium]|nr:retropepsin-like aspartic protease [Azospirillaceae bacterium]